MSAAEGVLLLGAGDPKRDVGSGEVRDDGTPKSTDLVLADWSLPISSAIDLK